MNQDCKDLISGRGYGFKFWHEIFTERQLAALTTFSDLIQEVLEKSEKDAIAAGLVPDGIGLDNGGAGARAYAEAVAVYLAFALDKSIDGSTTICRWMVQRDSLFSTFGRQALPMTWDFAEVNLLADCSRSLSESIAWTAESIEGVAAGLGTSLGSAEQLDAGTQRLSAGKIVSTDPPYYDNISYADLSDFFYVWLRKALKPIYPQLFATRTVPKAEELVASAHRHGGHEKAETFFLSGMSRAMQNLAECAHPAFPITIYYAFKQSTTKDGDTSSTGWETFLEAVIRSGLTLVGTWPMRTERAVRSVSMGTNALASSVVLVCRKRSASAETISRKDFIRELRSVLPEALEEMTLGSTHAAPIAPVDLAQAAIGPGMAVYSKYAAIIDGSGKPMSVRTALALINREIDTFFNHSEGDLDADTRFCLDWFAQYGWKVGDFGTADTLARAKGTSVDGVRDAGVIEAAGGKVRLLRSGEYLPTWDPTSDERLPIWEALHQLIRVFQTGGERESAGLLRLLGTRQEAIRQLAYRLYTDCERKGWAEDARAYNDLIVAWEHIERALEQLREEAPSGQLTLF
jgi:putative DNA methylase